MHNIHKQTYDFLNSEAKRCLILLSLASNEEEKQKAIALLLSIQGRIRRELLDLDKYEEQQTQ